MTTRIDDAQKKLGSVIRERRRTAGISQEAFATEVGIHRTYIGAVERGERNVSLANILRIARALNVSAAQLFNEAGL
jgi:transcriptional regulator with XRE-family HTH domain